MEEWKERHGIDIEKYEVRGIDKRQILRNCVNPEIGKYVFEMVGKQEDDCCEDGHEDLLPEGGY